MRQVIRSALVPYTADEMYALVDEIESYPEFLPWCSDAVVHAREGNVVRATLEMRRAGLRRRFRTRNTATPGEAIDIALEDGPFRKLTGQWRFEDRGGQGSRVSLEMSFDLDSRITDLILGPFFEEICNSLVDAFTRRAVSLYGRRKA